MYQDPLFLIGLMGAIGCIGWWILDNLRGEGSEELEEKLNRIGLIFSVLIIWRLFVNAGDPVSYTHLTLPTIPTV